MHRDPPACGYIPPEGLMNRELEVEKEGGRELAPYDVGGSIVSIMHALVH